jgi:hypothetical protein
MGRFRLSRRAFPIGAFLLGSRALGLGAVAPAPRETGIDLHAFKRIPSESGPVTYYRIEGGGSDTWIRAEYRPPLATTVLGYPIPDTKRRAVQSIRWRWRAVTLPVGGDECTNGRGDSAAVVYVTWRRVLRWYTVKYVWSAVSKRGRMCDVKRNAFVAQDTVIVDSGPPLGEWRSVEIDPDLEYRRHFAPGDPNAAVPDLIGIAIMTDGDQTHSASAADYAGFVVRWK